MTNFRTIIVPEALKGVQNQDQSVLDVAKVLHEVIEESPMSLKKQVERLQNGLKEEVNRFSLCLDNISSFAISIALFIFKNCTLDLKVDKGSIVGYLRFHS